MVDSEDTNLISKKFWSYLKSTSKSSRIPESVQYGSRFRSEPADQADIFNEFFSNQYSEPSNYDVSIQYAYDGRFDIDFDHRSIRLLLYHNNSNKA